MQIELKVEEYFSPRNRDDVLSADARVIPGQESAKEDIFMSFNQNLNTVPRNVFSPLTMKPILPVQTFTIEQANSD